MEAGSKDEPRPQKRSTNPDQRISTQTGYFVRDVRERKEGKLATSCHLDTMHGPCTSCSSFRVKWNTFKEPLLTLICLIVLFFSWCRTGHPSHRKRLLCHDIIKRWLPAEKERREHSSGLAAHQHRDERHFSPNQGQGEETGQESVLTPEFPLVVSRTANVAFQNVLPLINKACPTSTSSPDNVLQQVWSHFRPPAALLSSPEPSEESRQLPSTLSSMHF